MPNMGINITHTDLSSFDSEGYVVRLIAKMRDKSIPEIKFMFEQTVDGWENKPVFNSKLDVTGNSIKMSVYPDGPGANLYALVSKGSPPHTIRPRMGGMLRFQPGYRASTRPRLIGSQAKQRFGSLISTQGVSHPGFEAREFSQAIMDLYGPIYAADMQDALKR